MKSIQAIFFQFKRYLKKHFAVIQSEAAACCLGLILGQELFSGRRRLAKKVIHGMYFAGIGISPATPQLATSTPAVDWRTNQVPSR